MTESFIRSSLEVLMVPSVYSTVQHILQEEPSCVWCVKLNDKLWMIMRLIDPSLRPMLFPCSKMISQEVQNEKEKSCDKIPKCPIAQVQLDGSLLLQCILMIVIRNACQRTWQRWSCWRQRATISHCKLLQRYYSR